MGFVLGTRANLRRAAEREPQGIAGQTRRRAEDQAARHTTRLDRFARRHVQVLLSQDPGLDVGGDDGTLLPHRDLLTTFSGLQGDLVSHRRNRMSCGGKFMAVAGGG